MSSSLSVVDREDIIIQTGLDPSIQRSSSGALDALWTLLRTTNVDAARSSAVDFMDFVETCVYVATIQKDVGSLELAGVIFLTPAAGAGGESEYNMGFAVLPSFTNDGLATQLVAHTLSIAFDALGAHRVQARVLHSNTGAPALALRALVGWGFAHEGVQRRAFMHPRDSCWVDGSVLALLASDWATRTRERPPSQTLWDEMFTRHQREREELLQWDNAGLPPLKRSASNETIRVRPQGAVPAESQSSLSTEAAPHEHATSEDGVASVPDNRSGDDNSEDNDAPSPPPSETGTVSSWDAISHSTSSHSDLEIVHVHTAVLSPAAAADDAADEFSSEWDDMDEDDDDEDEDRDEDEDEGAKEAQPGVTKNSRT